MVDMIRTDMPPSKSALPLWAGVFLASVVLMGTLAVVWIGQDELEMGAFILLAGIAIVAVLALMTLIIMARNRGLTERRKVHRDTLYAGAFYNSLVPCLIIKDGKAAHANRAYRQLAEQLGAETVGDTPPVIDRLFTSAGSEAAAAIFRLHHMTSGVETAEEIIDLVSPENELKRYQLRVQRLGRESTLWQVVESDAEGDVGHEVLAEAPVGLFTVTKDGRVLATNDVLLRWLGGNKGDLPTTLASFIEDPSALLDSPAEPGRTVRTDTRLITRKGVVTPTVMVANWHKLSSGNVVASVALYGHSTLSRAEGVRTETGDVEIAAETYAAAPLAVLKLDGTRLGDAKILSANPAFAKMTDGLDGVGQSFAEIFTENDVEHRFLNQDAAQTSPEVPFDGTLKTTSGNGLPVSIYIVSDPQNPTQSQAYLVNVSARKMLEDQLVQSQKMQAIGQLAAGVAHDFNNLLTAIRLNTDELLQRHPVGDPSYPELQNINTTGARAAALVKKLLTFSRKATRRMERLDVTDTLSDMVVTLRQTLGERAQLKMIHARGLPPVNADKSQIDTVLMNLCVNARDAMEDQGGGTITIQSSLLPRTAITDVHLLEALKPIPGDDFVVISVADTGTGMPDEVKSKIFEPFFTTKEQGKGTGLGLATVYGIVQQSGGHLTVDSVVGKGTTFRIYLPAAGAAPEVSELPVVKTPPPPRKPSDLAGQGNILFVEDEASVRGIAAKALRKKGYRVIEAEDGEEALEILEETKVPFDLMISDVVMPGMDGPTLLRAGRKLLGDARIVFISGYAEEEFSELLSEEPDVTFLPKPFTFAQLAEKVKSEIGEVS
ncbi:signal transduction histidine kinase [Litorimonas cladophorae]|uniref:histidine kinase n=1 Tax=Litorimonas cladophorae TaxID=1220491 RepID=A0A918KDC1_9PROT|nr:PAS domain-containing sensor histidine kinase [Litorimonas cladophorae]GGX57868.1 signal transduction histidine kinase [Litorimonas cladophorae]